MCVRRVECAAVLFNKPTFGSIYVWLYYAVEIISAAGGVEVLAWNQKYTHQALVGKYKSFFVHGTKLKL